MQKWKPQAIELLLSLTGSLSIILTLLAIVVLIWNSQCEEKKEQKNDSEF